VFASAGKIGGFNLSADAFTTTHDTTANDLTVPEVLINAAEKSSFAKIANREGQDWRLVVGRRFGVNKDGKLFCENANLSGSITATSGNLTGIDGIEASSVAGEMIMANSITTNKLNAETATIANFNLKPVTTASETITSKTATIKYKNFSSSYKSGNWEFKVRFECQINGTAQKFISKQTFSKYKML
jgi:predicted phage tail protein